MEAPYMDYHLCFIESCVDALQKALGGWVEDLCRACAEEICHAMLRSATDWLSKLHDVVRLIAVDRLFETLPISLIRDYASREDFKIKELADRGFLLIWRRSKYGLHVSVHPPKPDRGWRWHIHIKDGYGYVHEDITELYKLHMLPLTLYLYELSLRGELWKLVLASLPRF